MVHPPTGLFLGAIIGLTLSLSLLLNKKKRDQINGYSAIKRFSIYSIFAFCIVICLWGIIYLFIRAISKF
jgi:hypothetical protein